MFSGADSIRLNSVLQDNSVVFIRFLMVFSVFNDLLANTEFLHQKRLIDGNIYGALDSPCKNARRKIGDYVIHGC